MQNKEVKVPAELKGAKNAMEGPISSLRFNDPLRKAAVFHTLNVPGTSLISGTSPPGYRQYELMIIE